MPRKTAFTPSELTDRALWHFWHHGFTAASMDDLVKATGVSRHAIYTTFGGKKPLFLACFERYQQVVVTPAFRGVEAPGADLASVAAYFETQIAWGEAEGLPGPGCFVANAATEVAPVDADVKAQVEHHNNRLRAGFTAALQNQGGGQDGKNKERVSELADVMVIFTNGLWSMSRVESEADRLRHAAATFLCLIEKELP